MSIKVVPKRGAGMYQGFTWQALAQLLINSNQVRLRGDESISELSFDENCLYLKIEENK